jgi:hypothetical protein
MKLKGGVVRKNEKEQSDRNIPLLVEEKDIGTTLKKCVCCGKASKTAADYDDLSHLGNGVMDGNTKAVTESGVG